MSQLRSLERVLIEKLQEWASCRAITEAIVGTFLATISEDYWSDNDLIRILGNVKQKFTVFDDLQPYIIEELNKSINTIKDNTSQHLT